jgi:hypothetical protein
MGPATKAGKPAQHESDCAPEHEPKSRAQQALGRAPQWLEEKVNEERRQPQRNQRLPETTEPRAERDGKKEKAERKQTGQGDNTEAQQGSQGSNGNG